MYDVIVVGGGPAGLQAALTLGRMHRDVLVLDSGEHRNAPATEMHNFISRDGTPPAELRSLVRAELAAYATVEVRDAAVSHVRPDGDAFEVVLGDGATHRTRRVLLATGVRDVLPDVPGLAELFGTVAAHCPFCHGHELAGGVVAVQGGPHAARVAVMVSRIAEQVVVLADGQDLDEDAVRVLERIGADVVPRAIAGLRPEGARAVVELDDGSALDVDGFFVRSTFEQRAPFAAQLGLDLHDSGCIAVDAFGRTSLPGVYAAGDVAHHETLPMPMASVLTAAAAGLLAAATCVADDVAAVMAG